MGRSGAGSATYGLSRVHCYFEARVLAGAANMHRRPLKKTILLVLATLGTAWLIGYLPSNRRFMKASISDSHTLLRKPPAAM